MWSIQWSLTTTSRTVRTTWTICFIEVKFNIIRSILWIWNTTILQSGVMVQIFKIFRKSKTDTLYKTTIEITFYKKSVHDRTYVSYASKFLNGNFTCFCINSNFRQDDSIHISCKWIALCGILIDRMICTECSYPVTFIFCCKPFCYHLIISTECSVFFLHCCYKIFCSQTTCIT